LGKMEATYMLRCVDTNHNTLTGIQSPNNHQHPPQLRSKFKGTHPRIVRLPPAPNHPTTTNRNRSSSKKGTHQSIMFTYLVPHRKANRQHHDHHNSHPVSHVARVLLPLQLHVGPSPAATVAVGRNGLGLRAESFEVLDGQRLERDCGGGGRDGHGGSLIGPLREFGCLMGLVWKDFLIVTVVYA